MQKQSHTLAECQRLMKKYNIAIIETIFKTVQFLIRFC